MIKDEIFIHFRIKPKHIFVRLGEYDLRYPNETRALDFNVTEIRIHKDFIKSTYAHDISIVKIVRPTIFNTYIWPVCLPPVGVHLDNKQATVIGKFALLSSIFILCDVSQTI